MKELLSDIYHSPIGDILIVVDGEQLCFLDFHENEARIERLLRSRFGDYALVPTKNVLDMQSRLDRYFAGDWKAFDGLDICTHGTEFQQRVWKALRRIEPGRPVSYSELAQSMSMPKSVRAVANANARNPVSIAIPCHRVIGKDGSMRGYAGKSGADATDRKAWLLRHEGLAF